MHVDLLQHFLFKPVAKGFPAKITIWSTMVTEHAHVKLAHGSHPCEGNTSRNFRVSV